jgi:hypothetical protein
MAWADQRIIYASGAILMSGKEMRAKAREGTPVSCWLELRFFEKVLGER